MALKRPQLVRQEFDLPIMAGNSNLSTWQFQDHLKSIFGMAIRGHLLNINISTAG